MNRLSGITFCLFLSVSISSFSKATDSTEVFLLTCGPGNEVVTIYGHSAIRIVRQSIGFDQVYSWGVYDFDAPNFTWKFAKGRLKYSIAEDPYEKFLHEYFLEKRNVYSQKINLTDSQIESLIDIIDINMRPENRLYLYDFFYDNCSTRVRDIIEKVVGDKLVYPNKDLKEKRTFRELVNRAQDPKPWLTFGTDLLIGMRGDKIAGSQDQMFLPEYLMSNLSLIKIRDTTGMIPLLQKQETVLDFDPYSSKVILNPFFCFSILFIIITLLPFLIMKKNIINFIDSLIFLSLSILSILMIFLNFITDHQAMKSNLNMIWLNPILILAFVTLFTKNKNPIWFRIILFTSVGFLLSILLIPQSINIAVIPIIAILIIRSFVRSNFRLTLMAK